MFCCLRIFNGGSSLRKSNTRSANRTKEPEIHFDAAHMGSEVILLSHQLRITGTGGALATAPLAQSKSYFEVKIQQGGCWSLGLATRQADLSHMWGGKDKETWCLCSDNATRHNNEEFRPVTLITQEPSSPNGLLNGSVAAESGLIGIEDVNEDFLLTTRSNICPETEKRLEKASAEHCFPEEGDIVGVAFDHVELNFYFNGKNLEVPYRNVKGTVYPVIFVGNGAILDIILDNFTHTPPTGFDKIMLEQSLL